MFSLTQVTTTSHSAGRIATPATPGKPVDWCGTPAPGVPAFNPNPARAQVEAAVREFRAAETLLNPVMPMWVDIDDPLRYVDVASAVEHAHEGLRAIDAALGSIGSASGDATAMLRSAAADAHQGITMLTTTVATPGEGRIHALERFASTIDLLRTADSFLASADVQPA